MREREREMCRISIECSEAIVVRSKQEARLLKQEVERNNNNNNNKQQ